MAYASSDLDLAVRWMEKASALAPRERPHPRRSSNSGARSRRSTPGFSERAGVRFRVLFEGTQQQALGDRVARVLESGYWSIGKTLNSYPSETLTVMLYTNQEFRDLTRAPAWAGGGFDGRIRVAGRRRAAVACRSSIAS